MSALYLLGLLLTLVLAVYLFVALFRAEKF